MIVTDSLREVDFKIVMVASCIVIVAASCIDVVTASYIVTA